MTHYEAAYATLNEVVQQLDLIDEAAFTTTTTADARINAQDATTKALLKDFIMEVSEDLYNQWYRDFVPYVDTLTVYANSQAWHDCWYGERGSYVFDLSGLHNRDLLSISSITLGGTSINSSYYRLDTSQGYPARKIIFDASNVTFPTSTDFSTSIVITGAWGYHENPSNMWADSGDSVQDSPLTNSATTLNVTAGTNFETYQYIQIEDEVLFITAITSNALTVERGVLGTSAVQHLQDTVINTYNQTPSVAKDVRRMVIREYLLRNSINLVTVGETISDLTVGKFLLNVPKRWTIGSV